MADSKKLTKEQIARLKSWAAEGLDLNGMQKKINNDLEMPMTFMEARFLLLDLGIDLVSNKPVETKEKEEEKELQDSETPVPTGTTTVTLDEITPAHAIIAGKVTFASGKRATWFFDKMGRIDWTPLDGEPSEDDLKGFEQELQKVLRSQMGGI